MPKMLEQKNHWFTSWWKCKVVMIAQLSRRIPLEEGCWFMYVRTQLPSVSQASKVMCWLPGTQHYESCAFALALKIYSQTLDLLLSHPKVFSIRDINKQSISWQKWSTTNHMAQVWTCDECTSPLEEGCWFLLHVCTTDFHFLNMLFLW